MTWGCSWASRHHSLRPTVVPMTPRGKARNARMQALHGCCLGTHFRPDALEAKASMLLWETCRVNPSQRWVQAQTKRTYTQLCRGLYVREALSCYFGGLLQLCLPPKRQPTRISVAAWRNMEGGSSGKHRCVMVRGTSAGIGAVRSGRVRSFMRTARPSDAGGLHGTIVGLHWPT